MSTLAEKISQTFLTCAICYKPVQEPKALSCNHCFCKGCLKACHEASSNKDVISCAICQQVTQIPTGVDGLPTHFLVSSLQETVLQECGATPHVQDIPCNTCTTSSTNANVQCFNCKKYLCRTCYSEHNKFIQDHKVVTLDDLFTGKVALSEDMEKVKTCSRHPDKKVAFYCEVDEILVCKTCVESGECFEDHIRVEISKAVDHYQSRLDELVQSCTDMKQDCQDAKVETEKVQKELVRNKMLVQKTIMRVKNRYVEMMEKVFQKHQKEVEKIAVQRVQDIMDTRDKLESTMNSIDLACEQAGKLSSVGVSSDAVFQRASLCATLQNIASTELEPASKVLGYMNFTTSTLPMIQSFGKVNIKETYSSDSSWELHGYFSTEGLRQPTAIAVRNDGNIAITCWQSSSKVYTRSGDIVTTFKNSAPAVSIAITDTDEYVIAHVNDYQITWYDNEGAAIRAVPVMSLDGSSSPLNSLALDHQERIIAATVGKTIAICAPNIISKFKTKMTPYRVAATSNNKLAVIYYSDELKQPVTTEIMDYSGSNAQELLPPSDATIWRPSYICCSHQDEIFISNRGDPEGVFRYSTDGEYLGCVVTGVSAPLGLAMSDDDMELLVVDQLNKRVNIYKRQ